MVVIGVFAAADDARVEVGSAEASRARSMFSYTSKDVRTSVPRTSGTPGS